MSRPPRRRHPSSSRSSTSPETPEGDIGGRATDRSSIGRCGERLAEAFLVERGWIVLARNFRAGHKEMDLVVRRGPVVAFVEVKTRTGDGFGHPLEAVTRKKRREVEACARSWLARNPWTASMHRRFDAVSVRLEGGRPPEIVHVEDAWRIDRGRA